MTGKMLVSVSQVGTGLRLTEGQYVKLSPASNLPPNVRTGRFYASPAFDEMWPDGVERSPEDSILLDPGDVMIDFYDLPNGAFFKAVRMGSGGRVVDEKIYHKTSQGTAYRIDDSKTSYYGSEFWGVFEVPCPK